MDFAILQDHKGYGNLFRMIDAFVSQLIQMAKESEVYISELYAIGFTPRGEHICREVLKMKRLSKKDPLLHSAAFGSKESEARSQESEEKNSAI